MIDLPFWQDMKAMDDHLITAWILPYNWIIIVLLW
jgi:hypothetical protein